MLRKAHSLGFQVDEIVFTGDSVAYCANPEETARLIRDSGIHAIMGNCEEALGFGRDDCGCGYEPGSACDVLAAEWLRFCKEQLSGEVRDWMASLPRTILVKIGSHQFLCTHATPGSINRFIFPSNLHELSAAELSFADVCGFLVGHSGLPFISRKSDKIWINSGAAGMPANDGTARVWYAIVESENDKISASTHPLSYDHQAAAHAMQKATLPDGYRTCLESGLWPSLDVLPDVERKKTGKCLPEMHLNLETKAIKAEVTYVHHHDNASSTSR